MTFIEAAGYDIRCRGMRVVPVRPEHSYCPVGQPALGPLFRSRSLGTGFGAATVCPFLLSHRLAKTGGTSSRYAPSSTLSVLALRPVLHSRRYPAGSGTQRPYNGRSRLSVGPRLELYAVGIVGGPGDRSAAGGHTCAAVAAKPAVAGCLLLCRGTSADLRTLLRRAAAADLWVQSHPGLHPVQLSSLADRDSHAGLSRQLEIRPP